MKNIIAYYYNLTPDNIHQKNKKFTFEIQNNLYIFEPFTNTQMDINRIYELSLYLFNNGIHVHQLVFNKENNLITLVNDIPYVLLKVYTKDRRQKTLNNLYLFNNIFINSEFLKKQNWYDLWIKKIDYFEYQISNFDRKYPLIFESFNYFIGLAENAIIMIQDTNKFPLVPAHQRIDYKNNILTIYDPLKLIIDSRVRDTCEYFKSKIFDGIDSEIIFNEIMDYLKTNNLSNTELRLFLGRFFYPSIYFDIYEKIIQGQEEEKSLLKIINNIDNYETILKKIYSYIRNIINIYEIEWLND